MMIDRLHLASWSLELDDAGFAQALAALGALQAAAAPVPAASAASGREAAAAIAAQITAAHQGQELLAWQAPMGNGRDAVADARLLADAWAIFVEDTPDELRIALRSHGQPWGPLPAVLQALQQPAVGAGSVVVADAFAADGRLDWQLPFRIAVLPDDPAAAAFANALLPPAASWPYRFIIAGRATPRLEVLVCSGSLRQTAARLLARRPASRAALVMLFGGLDASGEEIEPLLRIVAAEVGAEGVVCVAPPATGGGSEPLLAALRQFADELTHNRPLDMALRQAFGAGTAAFLGADLLRISSLWHAVNDLASRLRALPEESELKISENSLGRLLGELGDEARTAGTGAVRGARGSPRTRTVSPQRLARGMAAASAGYRFYRESDEASSLAEIAAELRGNEADAAAMQSGPRFVQHGFWRRHAGELVEERQRLRVAQPILLRVRIGPTDERWQSAPQAFPAHELPASERPHRLQLVFHEPIQLDAPLLGEVMLPRQGPSSVAEFVFTPRQAAAFTGRISVLHRGRVLQTVLIHCRVRGPREAADDHDAISQRVEARVREQWSELGTRRRFDAAFVLNHDEQERPLLTGVAGQHAWARDLSGIDEPVASINRLLSGVAHSVADYSAGLTTGDNRKLFIALARVGADLYSSLVIDQLQPLQRAGMDVDEATHIQIVSTRADAVLPFEFIYQYPPPDDDDGVDFCPNALQALADGACPQGNGCAGQQEPRRHVCPMGFWGLRKVIERHVYNPALELPNQAEVIVQAEPVGRRSRLQLDQGALLGYSREVKATEVDPLLAALRHQLGQPVQVADNWDEWKKAVTASHPSLLVAFPHNAGERQDISLEIGGVPFKTLRLPREYVHVDGPYPLLLLLGCDTASSAQQYANHIRYFRQAGAAVIVSTIATVFGPHAVRVGEKLLEVLLAIHRQSTADEAAGVARPADAVPCLGEALREAKRQALRDSLPMALCVVAFGDADWRL